MQEEFANKTIAVLGLARSGMACAEVLTALGATVRLYDSKPEAEIAGAVAAARALGIEPRVGGAAVDYAELDCLITSPGVRRDAAVLQDAVRAGVPVWSEIEAAYRVARAPMMAITGTNGKTTTTALLGEMTRAAGLKTFVAGNIAAGEIALPLIKAAFEAAPEDVIVAEISSFQLEWIEEFRPRVAALLNITPDHGDRQTPEEYAAAKWRIFENQGPSDTAVINEALLGDARLGKVAAKVEAFSHKNISERLSEFVQVSGLKLIGTHNQENVLAAALMARAFGVPPEAIQRAAAEFRGVVHRLEPVAEIDGVRYINNSMCTNADAFVRSLEAIEQPAVVVMGGVFKGGDLSTIARAVRDGDVRSVVLIGRSAPQIDEALRAGGYTATHRAESLQAATEQARDLARPGDVVVLAPACASFDMFKDFEDRGDQFKEAVRRLERVAL
ncbi:UDP-N-acetylmuramoylalanine--D-glutamate ligase [Capsulimonas corticalis]|uniref:UDP-N-acetylmuramoylalanine--D-glutamate ligase n=1 Tax=Capsulimonas corticalis TaxID=2219043 RepID=A0A402D384_9BACT|nr:UDP-N-acetylmuramoyl-L-alanine--D-glutamate ligase [Capsulimonas corticalis]BDI28486.1 UDP-N-acetylmuramoylalanine--D-glutamate ligase [Capsulimonas corticalis]